MQADSLSLSLMDMPYVVATTAKWVRDETCTTIKRFDPLAMWVSRRLLVRQCDGAAQFETLSESALGAGCRRSGTALVLTLLEIYHRDVSSWCELRNRSRVTDARFRQTQFSCTNTAFSKSPDTPNSETWGRPRARAVQYKTHASSIRCNRS